MLIWHLAFWRVCAALELPTNYFAVNGQLEMT